MYLTALQHFHPLQIQPFDAASLGSNEVLLYNEDKGRELMGGQCKWWLNQLNVATESLHAIQNDTTNKN